MAVLWKRCEKCRETLPCNCQINQEIKGKEKKEDFRGKGYSRRMLECFLIPLINRKVLTAQDILRMLGHDKRGTQDIGVYYKIFVRDGIPIYKRDIDWKVAKSSGITGRGHNYKNRSCIYYLR